MKVTLHDPTDLGTVRDAMVTDHVTLRPGTRIADAASELGRRRIDGAAVVDGERVVGILAMRDLVAERPHPSASGPFLRPHAHDAGWTVRDVMTRAPVVVTPDESLVALILRMDELGLERMPVVDHQGTPVGWISSREIIGQLARSIRKQMDA